MVNLRLRFDNNEFYDIHYNNGRTINALLSNRFSVQLSNKPNYKNKNAFKTQQIYYIATQRNYLFLFSFLLPKINICCSVLSISIEKLEINNE